MVRIAKGIEAVKVERKRNARGHDASNDGDIIVLINPNY